MAMKVLIVGNMGYVGPVLVGHLRSCFPKATLLGFDAGYFAHCLTSSHLPEIALDAQHFGDVRKFPESLLDGVDAVVQLAAISNDPMGQEFAQATMEINHLAAVEIARLAKKRGVRSFIFASSCSVYGSAEDTPRTEHSALDPLTAYARSKVGAESDLTALADEDFQVTCLRFATACGMSGRLRLDLVLNDFVHTATTEGAIRILSDGSPWRPLIHVGDMARAIEWAIIRGRADGNAALIINAGSHAWNYQVKDLAQAVAKAIPGMDISINPNAAPDKRSYRVDFSLFAKLAPDHQPIWDLERTINDLREGCAALKSAAPYKRLNILKTLRSSHHLNERLEVVHALE